MTNDQLYGLITGILFGFLLQKGRVLRYDKQIGALRMLDMTIVKFMMSAIVVGMVGTYLLVDLGLAKLSIKPMITGAIVIGGLLFGVGWGLFGYCPGTSMGAVGEEDTGRRLRRDLGQHRARAGVADLDPVFVADGQPDLASAGGKFHM